MKRQQFPHLVPRYRTDLVTSQVLVPNEHRLQVTSPSAEDLRLWFWTWVKSIQIPKRSGIFSVGFCFLEFHLKGIFLSLKKTEFIEEFGCNHSHPTRGDSLMATQGNVQFNCLVNPTSLSKIWEKYTHLGQIKILYQTEQRWINLTDSLPPQITST